MKNKILVLAATLAMFGNTVFASETWGEVESSTPISKNIVQRVPQTVCNIVQVPVYDYRGQASSGDVLVGALLGGTIGHQFGNGSGKDAMTVLGAILGADHANKNSRQQVIVGYRQEQQCNQVFVDRQVSSVVGYNTTVKVGDTVYVYETTGQYAVGTIVRMTVSLN